MNNTITDIVLILVVLLGGLLLGAALIAGNDQDDRNSCYQWAQQAQTYPGFFLSVDEAAQCRYWNIPVNAPVK